MTTQTDTTADRHALAGKYLTFGLGEEMYGLEILRVREIIGLVDIRHVPGSPAIVKGVIDLRGEVIPVVDLRLVFSMPEVEKTASTCIIIVALDGKETGIIVDRVSEVRNFDDNEIDDAPSFGTHANTEFILGVGNAGDHMALLPDISSVLDW